MGNHKLDKVADGDPDEREVHEVAIVRLEKIVRKFVNYEDFLDSQVTDLEMFYLEDRSIARSIKELGFHGNSEKITREQFNEKKSELGVVKKNETFKSAAKYLYTDRDVFLLELARREEANLSGRLLTVVFVRDRNAKNQEISSFIDFAQRLRENNFANIFAGRERLTSKTTDLSHFNWDTNVTHSNNSPNFEIIFHGHEGIQLKCKKDRRIIHLDPNRQVVDTNIEDSTRTIIRSRNYAQVILFDHFIRLWANEEDSPESKEQLTTDLVVKNRAGEPELDLYENVTAAIYEDDLMEIARNALGGNRHRKHNSEWVLAEILTDNDQQSYGSPKTLRDSNIDSNVGSKSNSLETSVLDTVKDLYDSHENDASFDTLGNFTFIQMIEQLGRLLPEKMRTRTDQEVLKIREETATVTMKIPDQDPPLITMDTDELDRNNEKIPTRLETAEIAASETAETAAATFPRDLVDISLISSTANLMDHSISGPQRRKRVEDLPAESVPAKTSMKNLFDPVPQIETIKALYPQRSRNPDEVLATQESIGKQELNRTTGNGTGKRKSSSEKLSGSKDHSEYFKQFEARMKKVFQENFRT